ncbi:hypothetical protein [Pseudobacillus wudalianchiensis]|nr:hypothetical protein [Bacillus wudalianchiensis]
MKDGKDTLSEIPSIIERETAVQPKEKKNFLTHADTDSSGAGGMSSPDE